MIVKSAFSHPGRYTDHEMCLEYEFPSDMGHESRQHCTLEIDRWQYTPLSRAMSLDSHDRLASHLILKSFFDRG